MEEVDKGCSEFCVAVGTVTRITSILIYSRLKALAVNLSCPSLVVCWLNWVQQLSLAESTVKGMSCHAVDLVV